jgi:class 3 adenylate cyclase
MTRLPRTPATRPANGQVCTILAFDIDGFTRLDRDEAIRIHLHRAFYEILADALEGSGLPWHQCHHEDRGDGALVIFPPGVPAQPVIDPLPERLRGLIRWHNRIACDAARMQLRVAAHIGPVYGDAYGVVGDDLNLLFRMLDAAPLRRALADSGAELALVISSYMYDNLVLRHRTLVDPVLFNPLKTRVKQTSISAWMYLPGASLPYLPPTSRSCGSAAAPIGGGPGPDGTRGATPGFSGRLPGPQPRRAHRPAPAARLNAGSRVLNTPGSHMTEGHNDNVSAP